MGAEKERQKKVIHPSGTTYIRSIGGIRPCRQWELQKLEPSGKTGFKLLEYFKIQQLR